MKCPYCGSDELRVLDTRDTEDGVRRRRECVRCSNRFTTYERISPVLRVVKSDGRREEFNPEKLLEGLRKACAKRPVSDEQLEELARDVQEVIVSTGRTEVSSKTIGDLVMDRLREIDEIAYVRFASVYLPLGDLESVRREIERLIEERRRRDNGN